MNPKRPKIIWTPKMIELLRTYYPTMFNKALAAWLKVSLRSLQRKAHELGIQKVDDFNRVRADGISELLSDALKKAYAEGRITSQFKKGVSNNPEYEFKPGHKFDDQIEKDRKDKIRKTFKKRKMLKIYGIGNGNQR